MCEKERVLCACVRVHVPHTYAQTHTLSILHTDVNLFLNFGASL